MNIEATPDWVLETQTALNQIITAPRMTAKLLVKPPFRFILDIVVSLIRATGFPAGVYSEHDLDPENYNVRQAVYPPERPSQSKPAKLQFLTKLITSVSVATGGAAISANPSKIVAGLEPGRTNELLVRLAEAARQHAIGEPAARPPTASGTSRPATAQRIHRPQSAVKGSSTQMFEKTQDDPDSLWDERMLPLDLREYFRDPLGVTPERHPSPPLRAEVRAIMNAVRELSESMHALVPDLADLDSELARYKDERIRLLSSLGGRGNSVQ